MQENEEIKSAPPAIKTENIEEAQIIPPPVEVPEEFKKWLETQNEFVLAPADQLKSLLEQLTEAKAERKVLIKTAYAIMGLFGFIDKETGKMDQEIIDGESSWVPGMLKSLTEVVALLTKVKMAPTEKWRKQAQADLAVKFDFIKELVPLLVKYGNAEQQ